MFPQFAMSFRGFAFAFGVLYHTKFFICSGIYNSPFILPDFVMIRKVFSVPRYTGVHSCFLQVLVN